MRIAITTPTGNIGRAVTERLAGGTSEIVLLCRDPAKVASLAEKGAEVRQGSLEDAGFVQSATVHADVLFWVTPANFEAKDFRGHQRRLAIVASEAIRTNGIPHVVNISSVGAQRPSGAGPVSGLHDVEQTLDRTDAHVLHLRPTFFYENFLFQVESIRKDGSIRLPLDGSTRLSMIATRDIAEIAAERLQEPTWSARSVIELLGPAELSFVEAARIMSEAVGRTISFVRIGEDDMAHDLRALGASPDTVDAMLELYRALQGDGLPLEGPPASTITTRTTLDEFARRVIAPMFSPAPPGRSR